MGEAHKTFWWRTFSDRQKQARTEEEAKLTNEKFGSHNNLSEDMKARIAAKVNDDTISYREWKKLTKPTSDETCGSSVIDASEVELTEPPTDETQRPSILLSSAVDVATEELSSPDVLQNATMIKQKKHPRRKGRRRMTKTLDESKILNTIITNPDSPSKLKNVKEAAIESAKMVFDDSRDENALMCKRTSETDEENGGALPIGLSQDNQSSSFISVIDEDERNGQTPISHPAHGTAATTSIFSHTDVTQTGVGSDISLDDGKGKEKTSTEYSGVLNADEKMNASKEILAHKSGPYDTRDDETEGKVLVGNPQTQKHIQIIDLTSNDTVHGGESSRDILDKENGGSTNALAEEKNHLDIATDEHRREISTDGISPDAEHFDSALGDEKGTSSNGVIFQSLKPLDILLNVEPHIISNKNPVQDVISFHIPPNVGENALSSNALAQSVIALDATPGEEHKVSLTMAIPQKETALNITPTNEETLPSNATAQEPTRLNITLDAETGKLSVTTQRDGQNGQSADVASNQNIIPVDITINTGTGEKLIPTLLDGRISQTIDVDNQSVGTDSNQDTKPLKTSLDTRNEKTPIDALLDEKIARGIAAVIESPNATQLASQPPRYNPKGNISVKNLVAKTDASGDFTRRVAIPKKEHLDILHNKVKVTGKEGAPEDGASAKRNDHNIDIMSAKAKVPSKMTFHEGNKGKAPIQDLLNKIQPGIETADKHYNQIAHPPASLSDDQKEMIMVTDQADEPDPSIHATGKITAQRKQISESVLDEGKRKQPAKIASKNTPDQPTSAMSNPRAKAVHFDETWSMDQEGAALIEHSTDKTIMTASSNAASDALTDKGLDSQASADRSSRKGQGSDSTFGKNGENVGGSDPLKPQDPPAPPPAKPSSKRARGPTGLKWAYFTHTVADEALLASGFWLFEKPTTYFEYQPYHYVRRGMGLIQAPIAVATYEENDLHEPFEPSTDVDNIGVWINTHEEPWRDVRSKPTHPDFQPSSKLLEYQACESLGIAVWRHERNLLNCRLPECKVKTADHNPSTKICLGCGPKTIVRYCSEAHQIADLREHWKECGQPEFLMRRVIDATTSPARFDRLWPAIRDRSGNSSYERSRQATYAAMQHGRYTLFDPETEAPTTLVWPVQDKQAATMEDRVERLLNYALFDHKHGRVTGLLYRMIRQCLILKNFWSIGPIHAVKTQFAAEFGCDMSKAAEQPLCDCEWVGARLPRDRHVAGCKRLYLAYSAEYQATGIQGFLEMMEGRFWVLRAWRQRHPTVDDWEARVSGRGFAGEVDGAAPFFGPGWSGWGSPADDLVD